MTATTQINQQVRTKHIWNTKIINQQEHARKPTDQMLDQMNLTQHCQKDRQEVQPFWCLHMQLLELVKITRVSL
jgi:hypothetical protein